MDEDDALDENTSEVEFTTDAEVVCPYCGEAVTIAIDPGGGVEQEYVEDCEVCCRPWHVHVMFDAAGKASVTIEPA